jgi:hypothetical protein
MIEIRLPILDQSGQPTMEEVLPLELAPNDPAGYWWEAC